MGAQAIYIYISAVLLRLCFSWTFFGVKISFFVVVAGDGVAVGVEVRTEALIYLETAI